MRRSRLYALCVFAALCLSPELPAQTVTATIPTASPFASAVNPVTNKIYVCTRSGSNGSSGNVAVIDGASDTVTATLAVGSLPVAVAVNPLTNQIYVANNTSGSVSIINGVNDSVAATVNVGTNPQGIAVNSVTNKIYVTNGGSNTVTVIDGATSSVTATVTVGTTPRYIAVNPVTNQIYVVDQISGDVKVIDGATNSVVATVTLAVASNPFFVAVNSVTNTAYVTNQTTNTVTVINGANNTVTATIAAGSNPNAVAVNPVTNQIYVANYGSSNVSVIDGASNTVTATVTVGSNPNAVGVNPVTNQIYVANNGSGNVSVIDGASNTAAATLTAGMGPVAVAVNPVTNKAYISNEISPTSMWSVTVIDGATNATATVAGGTTPFRVAVNPVTDLIYVTNNGSANVTVINGSVDTVAATVSVGTGPRAVAVNPVTNKIYVVNVDGTVSVIDGASNTVAATLTAGGTPLAVAVNPVTNKIYVANPGSAAVTVIEGATDTVVATVNVGSFPYDVAVNVVTNRIYVANNSSNNLSVIDGNSNTFVANVPVGTGPVAVAVNPITNQVYVSNATGQSVTVIDGATDTVTATIVAPNAYGIAVNPFTNKIYVSDGTVIDGVTNTVAATVTVGNGPVLVAVNSVTDKIYITNNGTPSSVTVVDGASNTARAVALATASPYGVAVNPVTNKVYVGNSTSTSRNLTVLTEQQVQSLPLVTTITPLPGNQTTSPTPSFTFTATSSYTPTAPTPQAVYFQVDTWQGPWTLASGSNPTFTGQTATLMLGPHILYAYAGDGQEASIVGPGINGQVTIGAIAAYPFTVMPTATTASLSSNLNPADVGQTVTLTATVAVVAPGTGTPTGSVTFLDGSTSLGTSALGANFQATLNISTLTAGTHSLTAQYTGDANFLASTSATLTQTVNGAPTVTTPSLPAVAVGTAYSQTLQATGGTTPYTWSVASGSLPGGLSLNTAGVISGTPTTAGTSNFTVQVIDANGLTATKALSIAVVTQLTVTTTSLPVGVVGTAYSQTLAATGGTTPYTWSITLGSLPGGLSVTTAGVISGTPTTTGTSSFTVQVKDATGTTATQALFILVVNKLTITTTSLLGGTVGTAYSQTLQAAGGTTPYTWSVASGSLPLGLGLSLAGVISGTPTTAGTSNFTVKVTDANGLTATSGALSIVVTSPLTVGTTTLPGGTVGTAYSQTLQAAGGTTPYTWLIAAGSLPAGLTLSTAGAISGTPTTAASSTFTVQVTDANQSTATKPLTIVIVVRPTITTASLPAAQQGSAYTQTLQVTGGTSPYFWSVLSGSLPPGLNLSFSGVISGAPSTAGTSNFTVQVADAAGSTATQSLSIVVATPLLVTTASLPSGTVSVAYSQTLAATGGTPAYTWSLTAGSLPPGLSLTGAGVISGIPTAAGTSNFTAEVSDANGLTATKPFSIVIVMPLTVTTISLTGGTIGTAYAQTTLQASGGTGPYTWSVATGSLAPGLSMNSGGGISGTPTTAGTFDITVVVADANGLTAASGSLSIVVAAPPNAPTCPPPTVSTTANSLAVSAMSNCSSDSITTTIDWGDGTTPASGTTATHTYAPGVYSITVRATNANNLSNSASVSVTVTAPLTTTVPQGQAAQEPVSVTAPLGVPSVQVTYQCTTAIGPSGTQPQPLAFYHLSCNINGQGATAMVTLTSTSTTVNVAVQTNSATAEMMTPKLWRGGAERIYAAFLMLPGIVLVGMGWTRQRGKRMKRCLGMVLVMLLLCSWLGCGGGTLSPPPPPPSNATPVGNYTVTGTGTVSGGTGGPPSTITVGFTVGG